MQGGPPLHPTSCSFGGPPVRAKEQRVGWAPQPFTRSVRSASQKIGRYATVRPWSITLLESQLFWAHARGHSTGATDNSPGLFRGSRNNGTVFLDEVGEKPPYRCRPSCCACDIKKPRDPAGGLAGGAARSIVRLNRGHQTGTCAPRSWPGTLSRRFIFTVEFHPDSASRADRASRGYSAADAILSEEIQRSVMEKSISGLTRRAQAVLLRHFLARQPCANLEKRNLQAPSITQRRRFSSISPICRKVLQHRGAAHRRGR